MEDKIKKFSVRINGHRTSVSLEPIFWERMRLIAMKRKTTISSLVSELDSKSTGNLSSAIRIFVLKDYTNQ